MTTASSDVEVEEDEPTASTRARGCRARRGRRDQDRREDRPARHRLQGRRRRRPAGFDIEMGQHRRGLPRHRGRRHRVDGDGLRQPRAVPAGGTVDIVIASYSITDERRAVVGQAGPYYVTGQQLLVAGRQRRSRAWTTSKGEKVCSVEGSTSLETVEEEYGAKPRGSRPTPSASSRCSTGRSTR